MPLLHTQKHPFDPRDRHLRAKKSTAKERMEKLAGKAESGSPLRHRPTEFQSLVNDWQNRNLPPPRGQRAFHKASQRALSNIIGNWVDSLAPAFNKPKFLEFIDEVSAVGRTKNERYERELQQKHTRGSAFNIYYSNNACVVVSVCVPVLLSSTPSLKTTCSEHL